MPHERARRLLNILEKRMKLFPVVGVLGARQVGKSTLIRDLFSQKRKIEYVTLDRDEHRKRAEKSPTLFIKNISKDNKTVICIDEIQKASVLFDTIKAEVDEDRRPGRYLVSGSTEFSKKTGVRESLTGRISLLKLYPLCLSEVIQVNSSNTLFQNTPLDVKCQGKYLKDFNSWINRGGMPGICFVRDDDSRVSLLEAWIETTCYRDMGNFKIPKFNPELSRRILFAVAECEVPVRNEIAKKVGKLPRQIEPYLEAFKSLFVLYEIEPLSTGTGKSLFYLFDAGLAKICGASEKNRREILFLNECLSSFSYRGSIQPEIYYYVTAKGSRVDFVVKAKNYQSAFMITEEESPSEYYLRTAEAFSKKHPDINVQVMTPGLSPYQVSKNIRILPWEYFI